MSLREEWRKEELIGKVCIVAAFALAPLLAIDMTLQHFDVYEKIWVDMQYEEITKEVPCNPTMQEELRKQFLESFRGFRTREKYKERGELKIAIEGIQDWYRRSCQ